MLSFKERSYQQPCQRLSISTQLRSGGMQPPLWFNVQPMYALVHHTLLSYRHHDVHQCMHSACERALGSYRLSSTRLDCKRTEAPWDMRSNIPICAKPELFWPWGLQAHQQVVGVKLNGGHWGRSFDEFIDGHLSDNPVTVEDERHGWPTHCSALPLLIGRENSARTIDR